MSTKSWKRRSPQAAVHLLHRHKGKKNVNSCHQKAKRKRLNKLSQKYRRSGAVLNRCNKKAKGTVAGCNQSLHCHFHPLHAMEGSSNRKHCEQCHLVGVWNEYYDMSMAYRRTSLKCSSHGNTKVMKHMKRQCLSYCVACSEAITDVSHQVYLCRIHGPLTISQVDKLSNNDLRCQKCETKCDVYGQDVPSAASAGYYQMRCALHSDYVMKMGEHGIRCERCVELYRQSSVHHSPGVLSEDKCQLHSIQSVYTLPNGCSFCTLCGADKYQPRPGRRLRAYCPSHGVISRVYRLKDPNEIGYLCPVCKQTLKTETVVVRPISTKHNADKKSLKVNRKSPSALYSLQRNNFVARYIPDTCRPLVSSKVNPPEELLRRGDSQDEEDQMKPDSVGLLYNITRFICLCWPCLNSVPVPVGESVGQRPQSGSIR